MTRTGKCNCGAVSATITGEPLVTRICWCRQCQKLAGAGGMYNAMFRTEDVELTGPVASWSYTAASGNTLVHHRCAECGAPVGAQSSARPQFHTIRVGFLDDSSGLAPKMAIWTSEKPDWVTIPPGIEIFETQPAPPPSS